MPKHEGDEYNEVRPLCAKTFDAIRDELEKINRALMDNPSGLLFRMERIETTLRVLKWVLGVGLAIIAIAMAAQ